VKSAVVRAHLEAGIVGLMFALALGIFVWGFWVEFGPLRPYVRSLLARFRR
jgi:hypothetical protein